MVRRIAVAAGALVVAIPAVLMLTTSGAGATFEFSFTTHQTNFEAVIGGQASLNPTGNLGPGDGFVLREDIIQNGATVGYDNVDCTVIFNDNTLCNAVFAFNNVGDLTLNGLLRGEVGPNSPTAFDVAVTGGTFAYRNAHGDAHAVTVNPTDTNWTVNFATT
jgi:hypothetical protein